MYQFDQLSLLYPSLNLSADLKTDNADFVVNEIMPVEVTGEGEHCWLNITKTGENTDAVATQLAKFAGVKPVAVSYAGLKDRNAITTQWFSVQLPGMPDPDWAQINSERLKINQVMRHNRKLKRGALSGNRFEIHLRELQGEQADWQNRLEQIADKGVPNYFGKQRFGHQMNNLSRASELIKNNKLRRLKPHKRGIYLSAMRSWLFNCMVSERLQAGNYGTALKGDVMMLANSNACFAEEINSELKARLADKELHLTAAMWGRGQSMASAEVAEFEQKIADENTEFASALERVGMKHERRSMRLLAVNMQWQFEADNSLIVSFELTKGSYATAVLRELGDIRDKSLPEFK